MSAVPDHPPDFLVIGGGTAGCILAARLSENEDVKVVLIEAGPRDRNPLIHIPIGFSKLMHNRKLNWGYHTRPQDHLNARSIYWPRGKVLGGSSSINGMIWVRGCDTDFDEWASVTNDSMWAWDNVQPYFRKLEAAETDVDERLGTAGRIPLTTPKARSVAVDAFVSAAETMGLQRQNGMAIADRHTAGSYLVTAANGLRVNAVKAYLRRAGQRRNLQVLTNSHVQKILLDRGNAATGILLHRDGATHELRCQRGVVLAAGAINSPQILMLSGVGRASHLKRHGIEVRLDAPGVGQNLQDHLGVRVMARVKPAVTINSDFRRPWRLLGHCMTYALTRSGPISVGGAYAGAFFSPSGRARPSMQVHFLPLALKGPGWDFYPFSAVTANVCQLAPKSTGEVALQSSNHMDAPLIDPNYLSHPEDQEMMVAGVRYVRRIFEAPSFRDSLHAREFAPGPDIQGDDDILDFVRGAATTVYHPVGTCRMGSDATAVVSSKGRVNGVERLWIADASIMPTIVSGNTNAATAMIAERISECIRAS